MAEVEDIYKDALTSGLVPGVALIAGDKDGNIIYSNALGKATLNPSRDAIPFTTSTICGVASQTKLMTSVAALKAVELGLLTLDADLRPSLPPMGQYGTMTGFDATTNTPTFVPDNTPISLRMLLSHTSGHEYDWMNPLLTAWRASRSEGIWHGATVEEKSAIPLVFTPGTAFAYGAGHDWAGKAISVASGVTLEEFMRKHIWEPLGIPADEIMFLVPDPLRQKKADMSTLGATDEQPPAVYEPHGLMEMTDYYGGAGLHCSPGAYFTFLSAVFRRDGRLLSPQSFDELFRPQLDGRTETSLNEYLDRSPAHSRFLALGIPPEVRKTWSFAGLVCLDKQEGRFEEGTVMWAGVPNCVWFMDRAAGVCGTAICQLVPPQVPEVIALHAKFQGKVLELTKKR
ncbi:hypothetical protein QBC47DRAFT_389000 [Echria macrotheca]|uniref:Beta-lactamase-related domain-containing protein n=1 Tax=Echria macrotheca TaxID=438768 RepID=A0AAJ0B6J5_9PEZI|nr:hypothetical protein QBC47DRAFT_389000 [Echria macrotheca]